MDTASPGRARTRCKLVTTQNSAIAINGAGLGTVNGLTINTPESEPSQVSGLDIENFGGAGVVVQGENITLEGCFIGTDPSGETAAPNGNGVVIEGGCNLGGTQSPGRNVISGNSGPGRLWDLRACWPPVLFCLGPG